MSYEKSGTCLDFYQFKSMFNSTVVEFAMVLMTLVAGVLVFNVAKLSLMEAIGMIHES